MEKNLSASPPAARSAPSDRPRELVAEPLAVLSVGTARWRLMQLRVYSDARTNRYRAYARLVELGAPVSLEENPRGVELAADGRSPLEALELLAAQLWTSPQLEPVQ